MKNRKGSFVAVVVAVAAILVLAYYFGRSAIIDYGPATNDNNDIKKFASYAELESFVRQNSEGYYAGGPVAAPDMRMGTPMMAKQESAGTAQTYSGTNIQVEGVDEADIVKTDGRYIYAVAGGNRKVVIIDAYPAETASNVSDIDFDGHVDEIFANGNRLAVFWRESVRVPMPAAGGTTYQYSQKTHVDIYDISDRKYPVLSRNASIDGNYFDSRMIGDHVYVMATQPAYYVKGEPIPLPAVRSSLSESNEPQTEFPDIYYFDVPDRYYAFTTIASVNVKTGTTTGKILLTGATQNIYVSADNIYITYSKYFGNIQESDLFIDEVVLPIVPAGVQAEIRQLRENSSLTKSEKWGGMQKVLEAHSKSLSDAERQGLESAARQKLADLQRELSKEREKTVVQKLSISEGKIEYKSNGEVPGTILNQFSMDEHDGYFRIATTTTELGGITPMMEAATSVAVKSGPSGITAEEQKRLEESTKQETIAVRPDIAPIRQSGPLNHVYVLDGNLKIVGRLEDLAPGERIYSVRFLGDKGYMVTFRQVDPLFVIDLSRPVEPKVLGFLKIPGVSDYLHPYDDTHVIGVGRDATEAGRIVGMKLSLFDVTNVSAPKEISKYTIGQMGTDSEALRDHKAFLFSREKSLLVIPVSESMQSVLTGDWMYWQGAYVFNLDLTKGFTLKGKISHMGDETANEWDATVRRSLYIDDVLYTISNKKVMANRLSDLSKVSEVPLPQPAYETPVYAIEETTLPAGTAAR